MLKSIARSALWSALLVARASAAAAQTAAPAQQAAAVTAAQRFRAALTYDQFAADTARHDEWARNLEHAGVSVNLLADRVRALPGRWHLLVVAESWCRDAVNSIPYLARLAAEFPAIDLRIMRTADAQDLLAAHLLDGRPATPLVLVYDEQFVERGAWIERPAELRALIKSKEGRTCEDALREDVARWRAADDGRSVLAEVVALMERVPTSAQMQVKRPTTPR